ncbi:hypothetical protein RHGRI_025778 [Rhododendron griersonianum]|uniref:Protein kinase domain-containing protein n=1 Tax=Rhododendron griersonianum TaxID=479676 RepID=A0AAV6IR91_9ERIC|nr:hypothetical protein RHGRI_025778 [Rhododendron griersonianum]
MLFSAARRKNRGIISITQPPAATGLSSMFNPKQVLVIMLLTAARRKNRGKIPITRPPAATGLSSMFNPKQVSMAELLKATHNFSPNLIIGHGSFGLVYKARLPHAGLSTVAVKKLSPDAFQGFREFGAEMEIPSKLRHPNIVTILGFCSTGSDRILVYEYVENGRLDQWLPNGCPRRPGQGCLCLGRPESRFPRHPAKPLVTPPTILILVPQDKGSLDNLGDSAILILVFQHEGSLDLGVSDGVLSGNH